MKKLFLSFVLLGIFSCSKNEDTQLLNKKGEITAKEIGEYHNTSLRKVEDRFQELIDQRELYRNSSATNSSSYTIAQINQIESEEIHDFISETEPEYEITEAEILNAVTITNNNYLQNQNVASLNLERINDTKNKLNILVSQNKILNSEKTLIFRLLDLTYLCDSTNDYSNFQSSLDEIIFDKNSIQWIGNNGRFIDYGIEVAQNSYYYWLDDANTSNKSTLITQAIPLWVGLDVVGALAGGGSSMYSQRNNSSFDWYEIGGQALIWGVAGSVPGSRRFLRLFQ